MRGSARMPKASACAPLPSRRLQWVLRPGMLGVASAQLLANLGIASAPKTGQIARDLYRTARRRQQHQRYGHGTASDAWGFLHAEGILQAYRETGPLWVGVIDPAPAPPGQRQLLR